MQTQSGFEPKAATKKLIREARGGALATLMKDSGHPYCSLVNVATDADGSPLLLLSTLAVHTKNLLADDRVSLMFDERRGGDPLEGARVMLMGNATATGEAPARGRYLARHPEAAMFADFKDFAFYRITLAAAHLVAGFGRIVDLKPEDILTELDGAESLVTAEEEICAHMNNDHADALQLYATQLAGAPPGDWRCAGCDPEGLELQSGQTAIRVAFPARVSTPGALRIVLKKMADEARQKRDAAG